MNRVQQILIILTIFLLPRAINAGDYLFPWRDDSSAWLWTSGWHGGSNYGGQSLDFAPGSKTQILAAANGKVIAICRGLVSKNIVARSPTGEIVEYWHINKESMPAYLAVGSNLITGQLLGSTSGKHSYDGCGRSTGHHIHWVLAQAVQHKVQNYKLSTASNTITSLSGVKSQLGTWFKSQNKMNQGKETDCWAGPDVLLINHSFKQTSAISALCYASRSITFTGSSGVTNGAKMEFRAGSKIQINSGFKATTIGAVNQGTVVEFKIGTFP